MTFQIDDKWKTDNPILVAGMVSILVALINIATVGVFAMFGDLLSYVAPNHFIKFELFQIMTLWAGGMIGFIGLVCFFKFSGGSMTIGKLSIDYTEKRSS